MYIYIYIIIYNSYGLLSILMVDFSYDRCFAVLFNRVGESTYITVFGVENSKEEVSNFLCKSSSWESAYFK